MKFSMIWSRWNVLCVVFENERNAISMIQVLCVRALKMPILQTDVKHILSRWMQLSSPAIFFCCTFWLAKTTPNKIYIYALPQK